MYGISLVSVDSNAQTMQQPDVMKQKNRLRAFIWILTSISAHKEQQNKTSNDDTTDSQMAN
jgi:hypothetical protein